MSDRSREIRREQERLRSRNYRLRLSRAGSMRTKRKPKKRKKDTPPAPGRWITLPAMMPYQLLKSMVRGKLMHHLRLDPLDQKHCCIVAITLCVLTQASLP